MQANASDAAIAVIIVNFRTPTLVCACIASLAVERKAFPGLAVTVVDNFSEDDSLDVLNHFVEQQNYSDWVTIVAAPKNGGYAYGNNLGFQTAKQKLGKIDYFWMLNPDTRVRPGATMALIHFLKNNPNTIAGSCLEDDDGSKQVSAFNFPSIISEMCSGFNLGIFDRLFKKQIVYIPVPDKKVQCDWLAGASLLFAAQTQARLGAMDEKYFLYFEEVDYLLQASKQGIDCWYIPESRVVHEVGAATGISDTRVQQPRRPTYWFESRRRYFSKNHGKVYLFMADMLWMMGYSSWLLRSRFMDTAYYRLRAPDLLSDFLIQSQLNPVNWFK